MADLAKSIFVKLRTNLTFPLDQKNVQMIAPLGALMEVLGEDEMPDGEQLWLVRHVVTGWRFIVPKASTIAYDQAEIGAPSKQIIFPGGKPN